MLERRRSACGPSAPRRRMRSSHLRGRADEASVADSMGGHEAAGKAKAVVLDSLKSNAHVWAEGEARSRRADASCGQARAPLAGQPPVNGRLGSL